MTSFWFFLLLTLNRFHTLFSCFHSWFCISSKKKMFTIKNFFLFKLKCCHIESIIWFLYPCLNVLMSQIWNRQGLEQKSYIIHKLPVMWSTFHTPFLKKNELNSEMLSFHRFKKYLCVKEKWFRTEPIIPANNYLFKVKNRNTRKMCEICSKCFYC